MDLAGPAGQHQRRGVELRDDRRARDEVAGAERAAIESGTCATPESKCTGNWPLMRAPLPLASIGRGGSGMRPVASTRKVTSSMAESSVKP